MPEPREAMVDPGTILPARPLRPRPPIHSAWGGWGLLPLTMFVGFLVYLAGWIAPSLVTDALVRSAAVPLHGGNLVEGSCTSHALIRICDLVLGTVGPAAAVTRSVHYVFGTTSISSLGVRVVGDPAHPQWLTTDLGLDYFWNRAAALLLGFAFFGTILVTAIRDLLRVARLVSWWDQATMSPVPLTLLDVEVRTRDAVWTVRADSGHEVAWTMPKDAFPFVLGPADRILGLMADGDGYNMLPLDRNLTWVALSGAEHRAALDAAARRAGA